MESVYVGIEIGGTKIQVVTGDDRARIVDRHRFTADKAQGGEGIREQISEALREVQADNAVRAIGSGSVDQSIVRPAEPAARIRSRAGTISRFVIG